MRPIWSGALSFGLINIPVRLYTATEDRGLSFDMLHKTDLSPIRYARICKADGQEIPYQDIVKGYEYQKGDYVVLVDEDFKKANVKKTKTIDMIEFTDEQEIDPIFYEKPYFLEPDKGAGKAYALLREALAKSKKVGVAQFVLHNREHLGIIKAHNEILILNQLRYESNIRSYAGLNLPTEEEITSREIAMAIKLIDQLTAHFEPENFHDTYIEELETIIEEKAKGIKPKAKGKAPKITDMKDIMSMLKQSLEKSSHKKIA